MLNKTRPIIDLYNVILLFFHMFDKSLAYNSERKQKIETNPCHTQKFPSNQVLDIDFFYAKTILEDGKF